VENAIKHGLRPKVKDRKLEVRVEHEDTRTKITIKDNGIGRQKSKEFNTTDTGKGMEIIKTIIKGYNQLHGGNISYTGEDVLDEEGEVVGTQVDVWV
jgi:LytS/YehU family sensor histidine kinase